MKGFVEDQLAIPAKIDYFATSLPLLLVFEDDIQKTHEADMAHLQKLAEQGLNHLA